MDRLRDYLDHMLEATRQAGVYVEGLQEDEFLADSARSRP